MKPIYLLIFSCFVFIACQQQSTKAQEDYQQELQQVFDVHDNVMPKLGKMGQLMDRLDQKADSTKEGHPYQKAKTSLKEANGAMMSWMRDFGEKFPNAINDTTQYSAEEYKARTQKLLQEKTSIKAVRDSINQSISRAEKLLKD